MIRAGAFLWSHLLIFLLYLQVVRVGFCCATSVPINSECPLIPLSTNCTCIPKNGQPEEFRTKNPWAGFRITAAVPSARCSHCNFSYIIDVPFDRFLRSLDLSWNRISALTPGLETYPYLTLLSLSHNKLSSLARDDFVATRQLEVLDLSGNKIDSVDANTFWDLKNLTFLNLSNNSLTSLSEQLFNDAAMLTVLDLSYNRLSDYHFLHSSPVDEAVTPKLKFLSLRSNSFESSTVPPTLFLEKYKTFFGQLLPNLDVGHNQLDNVKTILDQFPSLQTLDMSDCMVKEVDLEMLANRTALRNLKLNRNRIHKLIFVDSNSMFKSWENLTIEMFGNPIPCSCQLFQLERAFGTQLFLQTFRGISCFERKSDDPHLIALREQCQPQLSVIFPAVISVLSVLVLVSIVVIGCFCWQRQRRSRAKAQPSLSKLLHLKRAAQAELEATQEELATFASNMSSNGSLPSPVPDKDALSWSQPSADLENLYAEHIYACIDEYPSYLNQLHIDAQGRRQPVTEL